MRWEFKLSKTGILVLFILLVIVFKALVSYTDWLPLHDIKMSEGNFHRLQGCV
jgi:hypothetical protein